MIDKLLADLDDADLPDDIEAQVAFAERFLDTSGKLSEPERLAVRAKLADTIGRTLEWVNTVFLLPRPDMRRAFSALPTKLERHPEERLYPTAGWLGTYLLWTQETESPLGWHFWAATVLLSLVARRNFYWDRGRYYLFLNQYVFLLGKSGLRKSTTYEQAMDVFDRMMDGIRAQNGAAVGDPIYRSPQRITPERMLVDLTKWASTDAASTRSDTIVFIPSDELAGLLGKDIKGSDRLANLLTECYGGKRTYQDSTIVGGDRKLANLQISCLFASTPDSVRRAITESMFTEGLMGRVVTVKRDAPHAIYDIPPPSDPVIAAQLAEALVPWLSLGREVELRLTPKAKRWFHDWYLNHRGHQPDDPKIESFWNRKHDHLLKLVGVLQLSQMIGCSDAERQAITRGGLIAIDLPVVEAGLAILEDEERRLPEAFADVGADDDARKLWKLEKYIINYCRDHGTVGHSVLLRNTSSYNGGSQGLRMMMDTLLSQQVVERSGTGYRVKEPPDA